MALIINDVFLMSLEHDSTIASNIGIRIDKKILTIPYELLSENILLAEITKVENINGENITELAGIGIKLCLIKGTVSRDYLFITKDDWPKLRDYGLLADETNISIKVKEVESDGENIKIYEKRDLVIDGT